MSLLNGGLHIFIGIREIGSTMRRKEFQALAEELEKLTPHLRTMHTARLQKIGHVQTPNTLVEVSYLQHRCAPSEVTTALRDEVGPLDCSVTIALPARSRSIH